MNGLFSLLFSPTASSYFSRKSIFWMRGIQAERHGSLGFRRGWTGSVLLFVSSPLSAFRFRFSCSFLLFFLSVSFFAFVTGLRFFFIRPPAVYWTRELTETNHVRLLRQLEESRNVMKNFFRYFIPCFSFVFFFLFFVLWDGVIGRPVVGRMEKGGKRKEMFNFFWFPFPSTRWWLIRRVYSTI